MSAPTEFEAMKAAIGEALRSPGGSVTGKASDHAGLERELARLLSELETERAEGARLRAILQGLS